jgi:uncharacterized delta-60 repeat protein
MARSWDETGEGNDGLQLRQFFPVIRSMVTDLRRLKAAMLAALLLFALGSPVLTPSASATAKEARPAAVLDPSFGNGGTAVFRSEFFPSATVGASTRSGTLLVSGGESVELLNDAGSPGGAFGDAGSLKFPPAAGREFELGSFTIDPQGRLIVVGSSLYPETENPSPIGKGGLAAFKPGSLRIMRFLPGGALDPSFGRAGVVETDFGLPAPRGEEGRIGLHPSVRATGVTVDRQGRVVVTGDAVQRLRAACERNGISPAAYTAGLVARFREDGTPDPSFGPAGLRGGRNPDQVPLGYGELVEPIAGPNGTITYRSVRLFNCFGVKSGVVQLGPTGHARGAFGEKGMLLGRYTAVAGRRDGAVIALAETPREEGKFFKAQVREFGPGGKPVESFGRNGETTVRVKTEPGVALNALTVDGHGRILVGGFLEAHRRRSMVLMRLSASGTWQKSFGPGGRVATAVRGRELEGFASSLFFDPQGRLLAVLPWQNPPKATVGILVARYLIGS